MTCRQVILGLVLLLAWPAGNAGSAGSDPGPAPEGIPLPEIALVPPGSSQNVGLVRRGTLTGSLTFYLDCTRPKVSLFVEASDLYFNSDPSNLRVAPIPLIRRRGAEIDPDKADVLGGGNKTARFITEGDTVTGYPTYKTEAIAFEARDERRFRQDVTVTVEWDQDDAFKPAGYYAGVVKLTAIVLPEDPR
jgi:hypothetical protein